MIPEQFDYEYFSLPCVFEVYAIRIPQVSCKTISNKTADTVVCHFSLLYPSFKEDHQVIQNYIRDVINYFKKGFSLEGGICPVPWLGKYHAMRNFK
jgi:hypothetical protein